MSGSEDRHRKLTSDVIGAAIEVHRALGPGFLVPVYQEALAVEMALRGISFRRQQTVELEYKGHQIGRGHLDFVIESELVVEIKAVSALAGIHTAQVISCLKIVGHELGLLINFNVQRLKDGIRRVIVSNPRKRLTPSRLQAEQAKSNESRGQPTK